MVSEAPITSKLHMYTLRKHSCTPWLKSSHWHGLQKWRRRSGRKGCPTWLRIWYHVSQSLPKNFDIVPRCLTVPVLIACNMGRVKKVHFMNFSEILIPKSLIKELSGAEVQWHLIMQYTLSASLSKLFWYLRFPSFISKGMGWQLLFKSRR